MVRPLEKPFGGLNTFEDNRTFLMGDEAPPDEAPVATGGGGETPPPVGSSETASNLPTGINTTPIGSPPAQTQQAVGGPTLQQRTQKIQRGGQDLLTQYQQAAGPSRTYESTGAANILGETMDAGTMYDGATQKQIEQSQGFTGANYEGPMDLEQGAYQSLLGETRDARRAGSELLTGRGQIADVRSRNLGIGYGIARDEAYKRLKDPGLTGQSYEDLSMVGDASRDLEIRRQKAESIGEQRTAEEADIREQSRALVEGNQNLIADDIQDQMRAFDEVEAVDRAAYLALQDPGGASNISAEMREKFNMPEQTLGNRLVKEAHEEISKLREKYDAIKDIPLMTVGETHRGRNRKHVDIDGQKVDVFYDLEGVVGPEIKNMVEERQLELEELFGAFEGNKQTPGHKSWGTGTGYRSEGGFRPDAERGSPYRAVGDLFKGTPDKNDRVSLYDTGGLTMEEFADSIYDPKSVTDPAYMSWDPGVQATRGNVATDDQARRYNTIEEMLSQSDEIIRDKTLSPQGGTVKFDREGLEKFEKSELTRRLDAKEKMEDARHASRDARRKGRKEELEAGDLFGSLFDFGTSVATMDMEGGLEGPGRIFENTKSSIESTADKSKGAGDDIRSGKTAKSVANKTRDVAERTGKKTEDVIKKVPGVEPVRKGVKKAPKLASKVAKAGSSAASKGAETGKGAASKVTKAGSSAASRSVDMGSNQRRRLKKKKKKKFYEELLKKTTK